MQKLEPVSCGRALESGSGRVPFLCQQELNLDPGGFKKFLFEFRQKDADPPCTLLARNKIKVERLLVERYKK